MLKPLATLLAAALSLSCSDAFVARGGLARVALEPRFSQQDADILRGLRTFGLGVTSLTVKLRRPNSNDIAAEKTVTVEDDQTQVEVALDVAIVGTEELFTASLQMYSGDVLIFSGTVNVVAKAGADPTTTRPQLQLVWVGPGAEATRVAITPRDRNLSAITGRLEMFATAYDAAGVPITNLDYTGRIRWTVNDTSLGTIPLHGGEFVAKGKAGVAIVSVLTPNLLRDTVRLTLQTVQPVANVSYARKLEIVDRGTAAAPVPITLTDANGTPVTTAAVTYQSRNTAIATVGTNGAITGVARGQAVIVVRAQEPGASAFVEDSLLAVVAEPASPVLVSSIDRFTYAREANVTVSVFVDMRSTQRLGSTTVDVDWNPAQLAFQSTANGASGVAPTVNSTGAANGRVTLAMADVTGFAGRVELLRITFRTSAGASSGSLALTARELSAADFTDLLSVTTQVTHPIGVP